MSEALEQAEATDAKRATLYRMATDEHIWAEERASESGCAYEVTSLLQPRLPRVYRPVPGASANGGELADREAAVAQEQRANPALEREKGSRGPRRCTTTSAR